MLGVFWIYIFLYKRARVPSQINASLSGLGKALFWSRPQENSHSSTKKKTSNLYQLHLTGAFLYFYLRGATWTITITYSSHSKSQQVPVLKTTQADLHANWPRKGHFSIYCVATGLHTLTCNFSSFNRTQHLSLHRQLVYNGMHANFPQIYAFTRSWCAKM